jgi:hypothetical protein
MPASPQFGFVHHTNGDGTIDSICTRCFVTVATESGDAALQREERAHICDTKFMHRETPDGTHESICRVCFATVATSQWAHEMKKEEQRHRCDPDHLAKYEHLRASATTPSRGRR